MTAATVTDLDLELDRQRDLLMGLGYPALAGLSAVAFADLVEPLRPAATGLTVREGSGLAPFALVVPGIDPELLVPTLRLAGSQRPGILDRNHGVPGLSPYRTIPQIPLPPAALYLVADVERGEEFCNVRPGEAVGTILERGRTPLTIHEGIAVATAFPELLEKNKCFMLAGSRRLEMTSKGRPDRRVPALWISERAPKLGWCWENNPHTWLGIASAGARVPG